MPLRFRRSLIIASGGDVHLTNRGAHGNMELPGARVSFLEPADNSAATDAKNPSRGNAGKETLGIQLQLDASGNVTVTDATGTELTPKLVHGMHEQYDAKIKRWLEEQADRINQELESLLRIHCDTPDPEEAIIFQEQVTDPPTLNIPKLKMLGLGGRLFKSRRKRIEQENRALIQKYNQGFLELDKAWSEKDKEQERLRQLIEVLRFQDVDGMSEFLELRLKNLKWPCETKVNFDITTPSEVFIDVNFPATEEIPTSQAVVAKRGYKLNIKDVSATQNRRNFAGCIHGMGFRLIGECFHALPTVKRVIFSGFTPGKTKISEDLGGQCLYSVAVDRDKWRKIKFRNLHDMDVLQIFETFDLRRSVTKTLVFKPINPFEPEYNRNSGDAVSGLYSY